MRARKAHNTASPCTEHRQAAPERHEYVRLVIRSCSFSFAVTFPSHVRVTKKINKQREDNEGREGCGNVAPAPRSHRAIPQQQHARQSPFSRCKGRSGVPAGLQAPRPATTTRSASNLSRHEPRPGVQGPPGCLRQEGCCHPTKLPTRVVYAAAHRASQGGR
ncbi:hypothetical protein O3P69_008839 [Scylla paramamosain]|uniref:Uncharacterized protein n=1 Tax=Scylla paramamosain TaxID=85552 RepID=A0AAW0TQ04_SCYPA